MQRDAASRSIYLPALHAVYDLVGDNVPDKTHRYRYHHGRNNEHEKANFFEYCQQVCLVTIQFR